MQRNPQNPIKISKDFGKKVDNANEGLHGKAKPTSVAGHCPACKTEIPAKPGFRFSALKCPKCGASMGKNEA